MSARHLRLILPLGLLAVAAAAAALGVRYVPEGSLGVVHAEGSVRLVPPGFVLIHPLRDSLERVPGERMEVQGNAEILTSDGFTARVPFVASVRLDVRDFQAAGGATPGKDVVESVRDTIAMGLSLWGAEHPAVDLLTSDRSAEALEPIQEAGRSVGMLVGSLQLQKPDRDLYLFLAEDALARGETAGRISLVEGALRDSPDDPRLLVARGILHEAAGDVDAAREIYEKALSIDPGSEDALARMFVLLQGEGQLFRLEALLDAGRAADPASVKILNWLALTYLPMGSSRYADAIRLLEEARGLAPRDEGTLTNLGGAYQRAGRLDDAAAMFRLALEENPGSQRLLTNLGLAEAMRGDLPAARRALEAAIQAGPPSIRLHNALAQVYHDSGMAEETKEQLLASYALDPGQPGLRKALTGLLGHPPD